MLCRQPCIGVKQVNDNGIIFKRFQISLINEVTNNFDMCCTMFKLFNFQIKIKDNINEIKNKKSYDNIQVSNPQTVPPIQTTSDSQIYSLMQSQPCVSQVPVQITSQNMASCFSSFQTQPLQPHVQIIEPLVYPLYTQSGHFIQQGNIPETTNNIVSTDLKINATTQTLPEKSQSVFLDDINELKKITNSSLRSAIRTLLKLKDFLALIDRLDKIITDI